MKTLIGTRDGYTAYEVLECEDGHGTVEALIVKNGIETWLDGHDGVHTAHRLFSKKLMVDCLDKTPSDECGICGNDFSLTIEEFEKLIAPSDDEDFDY